MDRETEIRREIAAVLQCPLGKIHNHSRLKRDLKCLNAEFIALVMRLEAKYHIRLADNDLNTVITVADLLATVLATEKSQRKAEENHGTTEI